MANTLICTSAKAYQYSGEFTGTIKTSIATSSWGESASKGIDHDGTNVPFTGNTKDKVLITSGLFSSTIKTSTSNIDNQPGGVSFDGTNTGCESEDTGKVRLFSGEVTSTIKDSVTFTGNPRDYSTNSDLNFLLCTTGKVWVYSGLLTNTIKDSNATNIPAETQGVGNNGTDQLLCSWTTDKMYLFSGMVTSTIKTSAATATDPFGIETDDGDTRINGPTVSAVFMSLNPWSTAL